MEYQADGLRELIEFLIVEEKEADINYLTKICKTTINENDIYALALLEKTPMVKCSHF